MRIGLGFALTKVRRRGVRNAIRNPSMLGAVAGTPGTIATNWGNTSSTVNGLTRQIVSVSSLNGIPYQRIRWSGTATAAGNIAIHPDTTTNPNAAALSGQTWLASWYLSLAAGDFTNITSPVLVLVERSGAGSSLANTPTTLAITSAALDTQRPFVSRAFNNASTSFAAVNLSFSYALNAAVDFTLDVGAPQLEQSAAGVPGALVLS